MDKLHRITYELYRAVSEGLSFDDDDFDEEDTPSVKSEEEEEREPADWEEKVDSQIYIRETDMEKAFAKNINMGRHYVTNTLKFERRDYDPEVDAYELYVRVDRDKASDIDNILLQSKWFEESFDYNWHRDARIGSHLYGRTKQLLVSPDGGLVAFRMDGEYIVRFTFNKYYKDCVPSIANPHDDELTSALMAALSSVLAPASLAKTAYGYVDGDGMPYLVTTWRRTLIGLPATIRVKTENSGMECISSDETAKDECGVPAYCDWAYRSRVELKPSALKKCPELKGRDTLVIYSASDVYGASIIIIRLV